MLCGQSVRAVLLNYAEVLSVIIPQLHTMKGFDQHSRWHIYDVLEHTACVIENTPPEPLVRWAALFMTPENLTPFFVTKTELVICQVIPLQA